MDTNNLGEMWWCNQCKVSSSSKWYINNNNIIIVMMRELIRRRKEKGKDFLTRNKSIHYIHCDFEGGGGHVENEESAESQQTNEKRAKRTEVKLGRGQRVNRRMDDTQIKVRGTATDCKGIATTKEIEQNWVCLCGCTARCRWCCVSVSSADQPRLKSIISLAASSTAAGDCVAGPSLDVSAAETTRDDLSVPPPPPGDDGGSRTRWERMSDREMIPEKGKIKEINLFVCFYESYASNGSAKRPNPPPWPILSRGGRIGRPLEHMWYETEYIFFWNIPKITPGFSRPIKCALQWDCSVLELHTIKRSGCELFLEFSYQRRGCRRPPPPNDGLPPWQSHRWRSSESPSPNTSERPRTTEKRQLAFIG